MTAATTFPQMTEDLATLAEATHYRHWIYELIKGWLGQRILEIGSGVGSHTSLLLAHGAVWATDVEPAYVAHLEARFADENRCRVGLLRLGAWRAEDRERIAAFAPDTIVCANVLEHVENDEEAVEGMMSCLTAGGALCLIVPAHPSLYSEIDRRYGHFRRYRRHDADRLTRGCGSASVVRCDYFNMLGCAGWLANHVLLRRRRLSRTQTRAFDRLVPWVRAVERLVSCPFGLSLRIIVRKRC